MKKKRPDLLTNPYGETKTEFIEKYWQIRKIAEACWFFGVRPEELKKELKILMEDQTYERKTSAESSE